MTQHAQGTFPPARIALLLAAVIAAFAIGFAISKSQEDAPSTGSEGTAASPDIPTIAELEEKTRADSDDAAAWQKLGFAYFQENRFADAVGAYAKAAALDPNQAIVWSALGEARVMASARDPMPEEAVTAFRRALALDADDPRSRYFLAVKRDLGGDHDGAIADWLALLKETPQDAPWRTDLIRTIEQVGKINGIDVRERLADAGAASPPARMPPAARAIPGPTAQDLAAASRMPPGEQREMAQGMVERLESRLKGDPANIDGWVMLMRSRVTLGEPEKAKRALAEAIAANPGRAAFLNQQAAVLGIE